MSTNIDSLDIQIKTTAGSSAANIEELAAALTKLSASANLTKVSNSLTKLSGSLTALQSSSGTISSLSSLAGAMESLASIQKPTGLSSTLNQLKKLGDVTANLDDETIGEFASKMLQLSDALAPLATRINAVAAGFSKLPARVSSAVTATNKMAAANRKAASAAHGHSVALDKESVNLAAVISNAQAYYQALQGIVNTITPMVADAIEWDGIQFRFGRAFGEDAEEVYAHAQRINEALDINMQQFMQYSSLYGSLLKGFGMEQDKVTAISVGLTELSYDIWAAYNDRYKTLEDASEAIRSAITGEIEPIRNAGIALTEASMQEYLDSVGMAHISIEKLTEAQKAEVRYAAMVDAAMNQGIVGTYANETKTAEGAVRTLSQQLKSLGQAIGSIVIPILSAVLPYISAFVSLMYDAVAAVAAFFGISFFKIDWGSSSSGLDGVTDSANEAAGALGGAGAAAKKLKDYTMGFDELNVINPNTGGGGGGGGGGAGLGDWEGLDLESLWDDSVFAKVGKEADALKTKIKGIFEEWKEELAIIGTALGLLGVAKLVGDLGTAIGLGENFLGVIGSIKRLATTAIIVTIQWALMDEFLGNFIEEGSWESFAWAAITAALGALGSYLTLGKKGLILSLSISAVVSLKNAFADGDFDSAEEATSGLTGLAAGAAAFGLSWKSLGLGKIFADLGAAFSLLRGGASFGGVLAAMFPKMSTFLGAAAAWVSKVAVPAIITALEYIAGALGVSVGWAAAIVAAIIAAIVGAIWVATHWDEVKTFFTESVPTWFSGVKEKVSEWWSNIDIGKSIRDAMGSVKEWFAGVRDDVTAFWDEILVAIDNIDWQQMGYNVGKSVAKAFKNVKEWFADVGKAIVEFFKEDIPKFFTETLPTMVKAISEAWNKFWKETVPQLLADLASFFFVELPAWIEDMKQIGADIVNGIWEGFTGSLAEFWKGIKEWIGGFVQGFKDELEISSPSKKFAEIGRFIVEGLLGGISEKWAAITSWFDTTVAPKLTLEYWKDKFNAIKKGAREKLEEVKSSIREKWNAIKSWYDTTVAPKLTLSYWKGEFAAIKDGLEEKLDEAWKAVKDFFSYDEWKKKIEDAMAALKDHFKIPSLPKIKLEWTIDTKVTGIKKKIADALGLAGWPSLSWSTYASGGFPSMGEMFIAREAGPELVGRIGSKTTVANNDQIIEGISSGVYRAVVAAMSATGGRDNQPLVVYLDGKQIYASVKKTESERGINIMGNQLGYAY